MIGGGRVQQVCRRGCRKVACGCFFGWWRLVFFRVVFRRRAAPSGLSWNVGIYSFVVERVVWSCASWALSRGAALKRESVSGGLSCCHQRGNHRLSSAPWGSSMALNCTGHTKSPLCLRGRKNNREVMSRWMRWDQKVVTCLSKF